MKPVEVFEAAKMNAAFLVVTFFRGAWSPICMGWYKEWLRIQNFATRLRTLNAAFVLISSQTQDVVDAAMQKLNLFVIDARIYGIGDPENSVAKYLRETGMLDVAVTGEPGPYTTHGHTYAHGMAQPGCVIFQVGETANVLYAWSAVPSVCNFFGAIDRPAPHQIWHYAMHAMKPSGGKRVRKPKGKSLRYLCAHLRKD